MRLICPNCAAQYEIDGTLIPAAGREFECGSCGHSWHQPAPPADRIVLENPAVPPGVASHAPSDAELPHKPQTSAAALAILQEEAARELSARNAERGHSGTDSGPTAPLPESAADPTGDTIAADRIDTPADWVEQIDAELIEDGDPHALPGPAPQATSLRWQDPPPADGPAPAAPAAAPPASRGRGGYNAGFSLALLAALLVIGAYVAAPRFADQPGIGPALSDYRASIDQGRLWLYNHAAPATDRAIAALRGLTGR